MIAAETRNKKQEFHNSVKVECQYGNIEILDFGNKKNCKSCQSRLDLVIDNIKKYGNKNSCYEPFENAIFYPLYSMDFVRTGFMKIAPTLSARDYKDPKCVLIKIKN